MILDLIQNECEAILFYDNLEKREEKIRYETVSKSVDVDKIIEKEREETHAKDTENYIKALIVRLRGLGCDRDYIINAIIEDCDVDRSYAELKYNLFIL